MAIVFGSFFAFAQLQLCQCLKLCFWSQKTTMLNVLRTCCVSQMVLKIVSTFFWTNFHVLWRILSSCGLQRFGTCWFFFLFCISFTFVQGFSPLKVVSKIFFLVCSRSCVSSSKMRNFVFFASIAHCCAHYLWLWSTFDQLEQCI